VFDDGRSAWQRRYDASIRRERERAQRETPHPERAFLAGCAGEGLTLIAWPVALIGAVAAALWALANLRRSG